MKASELMLGDSVILSHTEDGIAPYNEIIRWQRHDYGYTDEFIEAHILPVPLTVEILERNSFERGLFNDIVDGLGYRWIVYAGIPLSLVPRDESWAVYAEGSDAPFTMIQYVHELQHLLNVCRSNKEIEL